MPFKEPEKQRTYNQIWKSSHPGYDKAWETTNPHKRLAIQLKRYSITLDEYYEMMAAQNGGCAICGEPPSKRRLAVDHDHTCCLGNKSCGKCIRGLICLPCNRALGLFKDSPSLFRLAADYLDRHKVD